MGIDRYIFNQLSTTQITLDELSNNLRLFFSLVDDIQIENGKECLIEKRAQLTRMEYFKVVRRLCWEIIAKIYNYYIFYRSKIPRLLFCGAGL